MTTSTRTYRVYTSHGSISVEEAGAGKTTLVFIHGNSSCKKIFQHQLSGPLTHSCRLIALDLPGHGDSDDATVPERTYTRPEFANALSEMLLGLGINDPILIGWSLGGHIAIEMTTRMPELRGLMICGAPPPIGPGEAPKAFYPSNHAGLAMQRNLSSSEVFDFARVMADDPVAPFLLEAISRCDGRTREILFQAREAGAGIDQRHAVSTNPLPLAVINGEDDPLINLDFIDRIPYSELWNARCHRLPGSGHAAFWSCPELFNPLLERFILDVTEDKSPCTLRAKLTS